MTKHQNYMYQYEDFSEISMFQDWGQSTLKK